MKHTAKELKGNVNVSRTSPIKEFFILLSGVLGIVILVYVALGFAVDFIVPGLPSEIEQNLGSLYSGIYVNTEKTGAGIRLQKILDELVEKNSLINFKRQEESEYKVHLVPYSQANAIALPGGNIVVFSALIKEVDSENALAFVLAHELGHFANKDHLRGLGRRLVLLSISTALLGADSSVSSFIMNSLLNVEMKFSRRQEAMADIWALDLLNRRYGHVSGASEFFKNMSKKEKKGRILYYFTTHPYPEDRINALEDRIQEKGYLEKEKIPLDKVFEDLPVVPAGSGK
ncbi:MAG: M48 family metallopeptidase [Candidatus Mariimomonas ferrooxydans]